MTDQNRYLCFNLGTEEYAIPLLEVKELIGPPDTTPVPQAPAHFVGIMNLRGQVLSIMDLRLKLGIKPTTSDETAVIILDLKDFFLGIVVDRVNSVHVFDSSMIAEKPVMDTSKVSESIVGVVRKEERLVLLLNVAKALSVEDKSVVKPVAKPAAA